MHQKVIVALLTSGQSSEATNLFRLTDSEATLSQPTSRFRYNRKSPSKFWFSTFVCLSSAISLFATPDPDLFDGRITTHSFDSELNDGLSESVGEGFGDNGSEDGSVGVGGSQEGEQRDLESVGGPGGGEAVGNTSSKDSFGSGISSGSIETQPSDSTDTKDGGAYGKATIQDEASSLGGGSGGRPTTDSSGDPSDSNGFGSQEPRNFEDFGFGDPGAHEAVEVNRSKASTTPVSLLSGQSTIPPKVNDFTAAAVQEASGGSQAGNSSLGGDYGTNLPSGL